MKTSLTLLIVDSETGRRTAIRDTVIKSSPRTVLKFYLHGAGEGEWAPILGDEVAPDLVLFHWSNEAVLQKNPKVNGPVEKAVIRLAYSGGGISHNEALPNSWIPVPRPLSVASDLTNREWEELLRWVADPERSMDYLPRALQPDFARVATALLILCRGFKAMISGEFPSYVAERSRVWTRKWWRTPFEHIPSIEQRLKKDFGSLPLPENVKIFAQWLSDDNEAKAEEILQKLGQWPSDDKRKDFFANLINEVEKDLDELLCTNKAQM